MTTKPEMTHEDAEALLVFLANDTIDGEERAALEAAIVSDPDLARELDALLGMRDTMRAEEMPASPGASGLARLMGEIDAQDINPALVDTSVPANLPWAPRLWKIAAVVLLALLVGQNLYSGRDAGPNLRLASGESGALDEGPSLRVGFAETATEAEIRAVMLDLGLVFVDGPSALGLYTLQAQDAAALDAALQDLSKRPGLIETVQ